ncbi:MAG: M20/M25/M40 family metallo-hydrolase [Acidobacteriota bacterium]
MLETLMLAAALTSPIEQRIVAAVERRNDEGLALLERVVNINSGTMNLEGVRRVGDVFRTELDALGFKTRWIDGAPFKRAGHLIGDHPGSGTHILLIGHLDTVFEADSPFQKFERLSPTEARGPGIIDMKGGDVIIIQALKALKDAGALDQMHVTVVMTGDEESVGDPMDVSRQSLREVAKTADVALGFEDGAGDPTQAVIARRGFTGWTLKVTGKSGHSSQIFTENIGAGAIYEAARILNGFYERLSKEHLLSFNPGTILGGTSIEFDAEQSRGTAFGKTNVVAGTALVNGDLRTISHEQREMARKTMMEVASAHLPQASAELTFEDSYPPMPPSDGNKRLLAIYDQASRDLGTGPVTATDPRFAGAADVAFVADLVTMTIDGIGLMGHDDHSPRETGDLSTLPSQTKRAAIVMYRLTASSR